MRCFFILILAVLMVSIPVAAKADYRISNTRATESVYVAYSIWRPADNTFPAGWRTTGWYKIASGDSRNLAVPSGNTWVYLRVIGDGGREIRPTDHAKRDSFLFWQHPKKAFTAVETKEGHLLDSDLNRWTLKKADFYEYHNGGSHTLIDEPRLRDLPAQQIYNQAINSVVWIHAGDARGSGVLIDRRRQLVVTNQHVVENLEWVDVFFPWRNQRGRVDKNGDFYVRNKALLGRERYFTKAKVIAKNVRNDLAILQLVEIPTTAREIKHDLSKNVEVSMRQGDKVHILGNPGERLWNWTQGTFQRSSEVCDFADGTSLVGCLEMEGDSHGGNSGGPVLNGQGTLIGLLVAGTDETVSLAAPTRNIKALLNRVPVNLVPISAPIYPKQVFRIRNTTVFTVPYQIRWSNSNDWQPYSLETGFILTHSSGGQNIPSGYPKIRFDHIAGDGQVLYRTYMLETAHFREGNNDHAPTYFFRNQWGDRLDLLRDVFAAPAQSKAVSKQTKLLTNYPNPFNPETWIPYQLSEDSEIYITISDVCGIVIRRLALGHQAAGLYQSRSRAAYWDGRNTVGEPVASGVYFYTLTAGDFTATRKLLILK